eukprot:CAMPEP_0174381852 /NCGR_PEP_ID=MMETSP0811_2-20130205/124271_1 /TAXON_ID=73025 ORGANISM="Eutreptiella gymnastica-like, Strain CCMP1594" /NCGR_SAMPLE_ID=MMETSP0811_2 /ASSEMBLY_ACC=CAM_ASM_000667 /LENGTH=90 /DNA_ID=CAMNT_0015535093 /DNA_START=1438 /DNA_END=1706 /DNA_ORIENTATION=-
MCMTGPGTIQAASRACLNQLAATTQHLGGLGGRVCVQLWTFDCERFIVVDAPRTDCRSKGKNSLVSTCEPDRFDEDQKYTEEHVYLLPCP